jgi:hypothetical protein
VIEATPPLEELEAGLRALDATLEASNVLSPA